MGKQVKMRVFCKGKVLASDNESILIYRKGNLIIRRKNEKDEKKALPLPVKYRILAKLRLGERALRIEPRCAVSLADGGYLISCRGGAYHLDPKTGMLKCEIKYRKGMNNPMSFTKYTDHEGTEHILFGDYFGNLDREKVSVYERILGEWNKIYSFPEDTVLHIHGIVEDANRKCFYVLTGDSDSESAIWQADYDFSCVKKLVGGSQKYRGCLAFPTEKGLLYATDTPLEDNFLYILRQTENGWESSKIYDMPGPCIYGCKGKDGYYFATSVEGDPNLPRKKYLFSNQPGPGVKTKNACIVHCSFDGHCTVIDTFEKDWFPMLLFQFGNVQFAEMSDGSILGCPTAVKKFDGKTIIIQ